MPEPPSPTDEGPEPVPVARGPLGLPKLEGRARHEAISDPGTSWSVWLRTSFAKVWLGLGFFVLDAVVATTWLAPPANPRALALSLIPLVYLEYLLAQYLWHEPDRAKEGRSHRPERPSPWRRLLVPVERGRWASPIPASSAPGSGVPEGTPDPREFL